MDYANDMLFGNSGTSRITATDLSPYATSPDDFGRVLATGIIGVTMQAMQNKVNEATNSGQLVFTNNGVRVSPSMLQALIIGGIIYLLVRK